MAPSQFTVAILPLGDVSDWHITLTVDVLKQKFGVNTLILPPRELPPEHLDAERGRYKNRPILNLLMSLIPTKAQCIMGVIAGELQDDEGRQQLGCAFTNYNTGAYSVLPASEWAILSAEKQTKKDNLSWHVIVHEFGHILDLSHCDNPDCIMHKTPTDTKMCANCLNWVDQKLHSI